MSGKGTTFFPIFTTYSCLKKLFNKTSTVIYGGFIERLE